MVLRLAAAFLISLTVTAIAGFFLIPALRRIKAGQSIREDGPTWHNNKQGTPTMGGIMFIAGSVIACLIVGMPEIREGSLSHIFVLLLALLFAIIGFIDDYIKLRKKRNLGLRAMHKFTLQAVVAIAFVIVMQITGNLTPSLYIPFFNVTVQMPMALYVVFAAFVIVGTVNAVNITDGADGLATGVSIPIAAYYTLIAFLWGYSAVGILAAALAGGLVAFLVFNFHPAKIFMGDTGSLFLGGLICAMAFAMDMPLILVPLGIVFILEAISDIIQVAYFKLTKGKRVFKMAPIHHHFEMCGWSEYKLFVVFTAVSVIFAAISYYGVYYRYS